MIRFLDLAALWASVRGTPPADRMRALLQAAGVASHDPDGYFVHTPAVAVVGVGGLPIRTRGGVPALLGQPVSAELLRDQLAEMMGLSGAMSYLNPRDREPAALGQAVLERGHGSVAHAASLNLLLAGLSVAAETELCCQRDLVHLSRVTVARTRAQDDPPFVVHEPEALPLLRSIRAQTQALLVGAELGRECRNNLYPSSRATMVLLTGSLRSLHKLVAARDDPGKEDEYRRLLRAVRGCIRPLAPALFGP